MDRLTDIRIVNRMASKQCIRVHRFGASSPDDVSELAAAVSQGVLNPAGIMAVLGKTEGNGCVNDFTRGFASHTIKHAIAGWTGQSPDAVGKHVAIVMSGGTEGGLSPHWIVFEAATAPASGDGPSLAAGVSMTRAFEPEEVGRMPQVLATAEAVRAAMRQAAISSPEDVHYVQVKCPLLTKQRIAAAAARGHGVATQDTYQSMGWSRGASALGVALALGEVRLEQLSDEAICANADLYSGHASTSAGIELMENQILVLGNSTAWGGELQIGHGVMQDAIDTDAVAQALTGAGIAGPLDAHSRQRIAAVLAKAEPSRSGMIRGRRHVMLDDSDIHASRHARALVGGVLAGIFGDTRLFVSGGAEHQGPDGGGPVAVIARRA